MKEVFRGDLHVVEYNISVFSTAEDKIVEKLRRYINRIKAVKHGMDPTAKIEDIRKFESRYNIDIPESC